MQRPGQAADVARPGPCRHGGRQDPQSAEGRVPVLRMRHGEDARWGPARSMPMRRETLSGHRHVPAAPGRDLAGRVAAGFPSGHDRGPRPGKVAGVALLSPSETGEADLAHHGRDGCQERPLLAGCRRERPSWHSPLSRLWCPVAGQGQRRRQFPQHEGPGAVPEAVYGRNRRRLRQGRQSRHSPLRSAACGNTPKVRRFGHRPTTSTST